MFCSTIVWPLLDPVRETYVYKPSFSFLEMTQTKFFSSIRKNSIPAIGLNSNNLHDQSSNIFICYFSYFVCFIFRPTGRTDGQRTDGRRRDERRDGRTDRGRRRRRRDMTGRTDRGRRGRRRDGHDGTDGRTIYIHTYIYIHIHAYVQFQSFRDDIGTKILTYK